MPGNTTELQLSDNALTVLRAADLAALPRLTHLYADYNAVVGIGDAIASLAEGYYGSPSELTRRTFATPRCASWATRFKPPMLPSTALTRCASCCTLHSCAAGVSAVPALLSACTPPAGAWPC